MLSGILLFFSACVATALATQCFYEDDPIPGTSLYKLKSMSCEHGCCGTLSEQKCCKGLNWWMIFAFAIVGALFIFVIVTAVTLIVKKNNKKKEQVGQTSSHAYETQPSVVDMSIFQTENSRSHHPPPYTFISHDSPDRTRAQPRQHISDRDIQNMEYRASWRDSDFSYLDRYLERSKNAENDGWNSPLDYAALSRTENGQPSSKIAAEFEEPRPYHHPDLTAESRYLGNTTERPSESPTLEIENRSQFHFMANN